MVISDRKNDFNSAKLTEFQYEMNYLGERKSDEETLKSEICRKLPDFSKVELKGAAKSFLSFFSGK